MIYSKAVLLAVLIAPGKAFHEHSRPLTGREEATSLLPDLAYRLAQLETQEFCVCHSLLCLLTQAKRFLSKLLKLVSH